MKDPAWAKNSLFITLVVGGVTALTIYLMSPEQIAAPNSFSPDSTRQLEIERVAQEVDDAFEDEWKSDSLVPTGQATNLAIIRRLSLGLAGTIPSFEEIRRLETIPPEQQIQWWVARLLEDRRTSNYLGERFARAFVGVEDGPFLVYRRRRFVSWLSDQFQSNLRYDQLVTRILIDEGLWTDTPSVNFYTRTIPEDNEAHPDPILLAGRTSRAFLGMRIDCLQCHDDFLGTINLGSEDSPTGGTQDDFHSLAAFFAQIENSLLGIRDQPGLGPYQFQLLYQDEPEAIPAEFPFNRELDSHSENLRQRLADWITHPENRPFARATVNRIWAIMSGQPLVQPVDHIPLDGPFPKAMEVLADDFINNDFDLHRLIRVIASTQVFQRASTADFEVTTTHRDAWTVFPMSRLRPDQVAGAVIQSTKLTTIDSTAHILERLTKFGQQTDFVKRFGDPGEDEFDDRGETVSQRLLMLNGSMIGDRLKSIFNSPTHLSGLAPDATSVIDTVFLSTLTRYPTEDERIEFVRMIDSKTDRARTHEIVDIYWSLINSAEFRWNH